MHDLHATHPDLFEPNALMPVQYFTAAERHRARSGPHRLMLAMLEDAARIYARVGVPAAGGRRLLRETDRWVRSNDRRWPFSFLRVCEALGLNALVVRRGLLQLRLEAAGTGDRTACRRTATALDEALPSVA